MFITFEGIEGSGKSTQIKLLADHLQKHGRTVVLTREPGGTIISDQIRRVLLDSANQGMVPDCEQLLYWAARAQHIQELILPSLKSGKIVLCDRYVDSTVAYQGYGRGIDFKKIALLNDLVTQNLPIQKTFLFDLPVEEGLVRAFRRISRKVAQHKEDRFEKEEIKFHEKVRRGFLEIASHEPERFVIIDATKEKASVHKKIVFEVEKLFI